MLRDFAVRGYVLDRKRLENGSFLGDGYFEQLLGQVREIRLSGRRFYQKVADIYATAIDDNRDAPTTTRSSRRSRTSSTMPFTGTRPPNS